MKQNFLYIAMVFAMFFWGGSWASSKILIEYAPAHIIALWRFVFVLLTCFLIMLCLKISFKLDKNLLKWVVLAGICNALYSLLFFIALNYGSAGRGGVLVTTTTPLFVYIILRAFMYYKAYKYKNKITKSPKNEIFGLILAVASGLCLLDLSSTEELFGKFNTFFLLASFDWAIMSLITQKFNLHPLAINFWVTLISVIFFSPFLLESQTYFLFEADMIFWLNLSFISLFSTVVGTGIYYLAIQHLGAFKANSFLLLVPVATLLTSYLFLNELPSLLTIFGALLAIIAIYCINIYGKKIKS